MGEWYGLDGDTPVRVAAGDVDWKNRWRMKTQIGDTTISTVFLGLDHSYRGGPPVLFETLIFGGTLDQHGDRYCTKAEAETGHSAWVRRIEALQDIGG